MYNGTKNSHCYSCIKSVDIHGIRVYVYLLSLEQSVAKSCAFRSITECYSGSSSPHADFFRSQYLFLNTALQIFSFGSIHDIMCLHNQRAVGVILSEGRWCLYDGIWSYDFNDRFCGLTDTYSEFPQYKEITAPTAKWCGYFLLNNSIANRQLVVWKGRC